MCIRVLGGIAAQVCRVGDVIIAAGETGQPGGAVKKGEVVRAVIVRTAKEYGRADGSHIRFDDNAAVIINVQNNPRGTRIFGPVARELRERGFMKILSQAPEVLVNDGYVTRRSHNVKKDDKVLVLAGKDGQAGHGQPHADHARTDRVVVGGVNIVKQAHQGPAGRAPGRHHRHGGAAAYLQRDADLHASAASPPASARTPAARWHDACASARSATK